MYLPELDIINLLLKKEYYKDYYSLIDLDYIKEYYKELYYLYKTLESLHSSVENNLTLPDLQAFFFSTYPDVDKASYLDLFDRLTGSPISDEVGVALVGVIKRRKDALKLSEGLFKVSQGKELDEELERGLSTFISTENTEHNTGIRRVTTELKVLINDTFQTAGLRWRLNCLNASLGSLREGDFGFIFARPETGKTTFLASEVSNFLPQATRPIIWFNNEEDGDKVMIRVYQATFGVPLDVLVADMDRYEAEFNSLYGHLFQMYDDANIHRRDVEAIIKSENPIGVVYDQIDKIKGFQNDREDLRLGSIYQWGRELAKNRHAAIAVCQANGTGEGVRYLTMEHVANATTAKQAEADFILGIGKDRDPAMDRVRFLNISKNKLFGDTDSQPDLKHGRFEVLINPQVARYQDIVTYS